MKGGGETEEVPEIRLQWRVGSERSMAFDSFVVSREFALEGLVELCSAENVGMFNDACVFKVEPSKATDVFDYVAEEMEIEAA